MNTPLSQEDEMLIREYVGKLSNQWLFHKESKGEVYRTTELRDGTMQTIWYFTPSEDIERMRQLYMDRKKRKQ